MVKIIEYDDFNLGKNVPISQKRNTAHYSVFLSKTKKILEKYNYLVVRNFGTDIEDFKQIKIPGASPLA